MVQCAFCCDPEFSPSTILKFRILTISITFVYFAHFFACLWYAIGDFGAKSDFFDSNWVSVAGLDDEDYSVFEKYSTSVYWAVITLFTTGYGDIFAHNTLEQWVAIICVAVGSGYVLICCQSNFLCLPLGFSFRFGEDNNGQKMDTSKYQMNAIKHSLSLSFSLSLTLSANV